MSEKEKIYRTRNWAMVVYQDSSPADLIDKIDELHVQALLSPLHDKDEDANGEKKKPHWHLLLAFDGVKSYDQVNEIAKEFGTQHPVKVQSIKGYARYLIHMDNPEKHQYDRRDIRSFAGADVDEWLKPSSGQRYDMIAQMVDFVNACSITEFSELVEYSATYHRDDWFPLLCDSASYVMGQYIKSKRFQTMAAASIERDPLMRQGTKSDLDGLTIYDRYLDGGNDTADDGDLPVNYDELSDEKNEDE